MAVDLCMDVGLLRRVCVEVVPFRRALLVVFGHFVYFCAV